MQMLFYQYFTIDFTTEKILLPNFTDEANLNECVPLTVYYYL